MRAADVEQALKSHMKVNLAPEKLAALFDSFTRGDTHGQPGVGLGLSIARQASDLLGARLWAESTPGVGTTFYLQLPAAHVAAAQSGSGTESARPQG